MPPRLLIRAQPLSGITTTYGTDLRRGVSVEDFQCTADSWGPLDATWTLKRSSRIGWPDLGFWTPVEVELENQMLWSGRIISTPGRDADEDVITVNAQGWQYHLDDRPFSKWFVKNAISEWTDIRSNTTVNLAQLVTVPRLASETGGITMTVGQGDVRPANTGGGLYIDLGPSPPTNPRIVVTWQHAANDATSTLVLCAANTVAALNGTVFSNVVTLTGATTGTYAVTVTGTNRYLALLLVDNAATTYTSPGEVYIKISAIQVFASTAYESGNASVLKASDVLLDAFARLPSIPAGNIGTTSFSLPAFSVDQQTCRDEILAANAFQDWQARVTADRVLEYRARPTTPILSLTDQAAFDDISAGSGDAIYNEVTYTGTGPDGIPVIVTRTATAAGLALTIPDRRGGTKGYTISSSAPLTSAAATQLCDVFLSQRNRTPFKGTIHATSRRSVGINPAGANCPPYQLLCYPGELCTFKHLQDPDTGALGRDGRIAKVTYTWSSDSAEVDIDSTAGSFEALLSRLAIATAR